MDLDALLFDAKLADIGRALARIRREVTALRVSILEVKYRPDQPRVPAGSPQGGEWTDAEGGGAGTRDASGMDDGVFHPDDPTNPNVIDVAQPGRGAPVDLRTEGGGGQHAIEKHVAKSTAELKASIESGDIHGTFYTEYDVRPVGSFDSVGSANRYVNDVLDRNADTVADVAAGRRSGAYLKVRYNSPTGREAYRQIFFGDFVTTGFRPTFYVAVSISRAGSARI